MRGFIPAVEPGYSESVPAQVFMNKVPTDFPQRTFSAANTSSSELFSLVEAATAGDRRCEDELLARLRPGLRCTLARKLSPDDVDDAVQQILLMVLKNVRAGRLQDPATIVGYVRTIALRYIVR